MNALLTGIYTKFNAANTLKTALSSRLYTRYVPPGAAYPYGVLNIIGMDADWNFTQAMETVRAQFTFVSNSTGEAEIGNLLDYCMALFDDCALTVAGYQQVYMHRVNDFMGAEPVNDLRTYVVEYEILLIK